MARKTKAPGGVVIRHSQRCSTRTGGKRCNCTPSYEAWVYDAKVGAKVRRSFKGDPAAAQSWLTTASLGLKQNTLTAKVNRATLEETVREWFEGVEAGRILAHRGKTPYKPSAVRSYKTSLFKHVLPVFGRRRLADVSTFELQEFVEQMIGSGVSASTIRNAVNPLSAIYGRAVRRGEVTLNPCRDLELPRSNGKRDRVADASEAPRLLAALPDEDRALWATALYAGLRRGELRALRCRNVDLAAGFLSVESSWDDYEGEIAPKSSAGTRLVPIPATLAPYLTAHLERTGRTGSDLIFGTSATHPFTPTHITDRADAAWAATVVGAFLAQRSIALERITLHNCRHSYGSYLDAAGISETRANRYMGHSDNTVPTRYRHSLEGQLAEDGARLEAYLSGATAGKVVTLAAAS